MKLYFLRHGETGINRIGGRFQGQINTPEAALSAEGKAQAAEAGQEFLQKGLHFDQVISSPQERAMQTAVLASGFAEENILQDDRLKEMNFGPFEGEVWEKMDPKKFRALMEEFDQYYPGPGMESGYQLLRRVSIFLEDLKRKNPGGNILVSTHGGVVRAMLVILHEAPMRKFWGTSVGNCAWYELTLEADRWVLTDRDDKADRDLGAKH